MRETSRKPIWIRGARLAALAVAALLLAGCATGYSFVQPNVAGAGGYYTGDGPYTGQGYYDVYGTGPYYSGTSGYGYYNGTRPYGNAYGYYGRNYGYGYGSQWIFNLGVSNAWNFPGYWGPWYSTGFPRWGCYSWRCGNRHHRHHRGRHHDGPWRETGNPGAPSEVADTAEPPANSALDRRRLRRETVSGLRHERYIGSPARPVRVQRLRVDSRFGNRSIRPGTASIAAPAPRPVSRAPRATSRSVNRAPSATPRPIVRPVRPAAPVRSVVPARTRHNGAPATKIP